MIEKKWFTLAELIITITIVAILGTISTVYFFDSFSNSRDSARISDFDTITKTLEIFFTEKGFYPHPDSPTEITFNWATAWTQGTLGENVNRNLDVFGEKYPVDPLYENEYTYSVTNFGTEFQLATIIEDLWGLETSPISSLFVPQANAAISTALVRGNYNGFMIKPEAAGIHYFIASPSIISSDITDTDAVSIITNQKLVFSEFFNLPHSYASSLPVDGGFNFNVVDPIIYSGSLDDLQSQDNLITLIDNLKYTYSVTPTESFEQYLNVIEQDGYTKIKRLLEDAYKIRFDTHFDCGDILDSWQWVVDGLYSIDPDGSGPLSKKDVYCDMTTDWGWWTRVGDNHLTNGNFLGGAWIASNYYTLYHATSDNAIVSQANPIETSSYVMNQTWDENSNYEVHFDDNSQLERGYEIRMSLWVRDESDSWPNTLGLNPSEGYMFHNRLFYQDGTFSTNGSLETLETRDIGWNTWKHQRVRHTIKKTPQDFNWYIGLDTEDPKNLYFTGVRLELFYR